MVNSTRKRKEKALRRTGILHHHPTTLGEKRIRKGHNFSELTIHVNPFARRKKSWKNKEETLRILSSTFCEGSSPHQGCDIYFIFWVLRCQFRWCQFPVLNPLFNGKFPPIQLPTSKDGVNTGRIPVVNITHSGAGWPVTPLALPTSCSVISGRFLNLSVPVSSSIK